VGKLGDHAFLFEIGFHLGKVNVTKPECEPGGVSTVLASFEMLKRGSCISGKVAVACAVNVLFGTDKASSSLVPYDNAVNVTIT
jgi:hypothetical protein